MPELSQELVDELLDDIERLCRLLLGLKRQRGRLRKRVADLEAALAASDVLLAAAMDAAANPPTTTPEVAV